MAERLCTQSGWRGQIYGIEVGWWVCHCDDEDDELLMVGLHAAMDPRPIGHLVYHMKWSMAILKQRHSTKYRSVLGL
jgi:hypothetical protein